MRYWENVYLKYSNYLLDNLVRIAVDLELPHANFNLYKFMKIQLNFINQKNKI